MPGAVVKLVRHLRTQARNSLGVRRPSARTETSTSAGASKNSGAQGPPAGEPPSGNLQEPDKVTEPRVSELLIFDSKLNPASTSADESAARRRRPRGSSEEADEQAGASTASAELPRREAVQDGESGADQRPPQKKKPVRDDFELRRFTTSQKSVFGRALREIKAGRKDSCWMWFIVPTPPYIVDGVEMGSSTNRRYSLRSDEEVHAFLNFEADGVHLGRNYLEILTAMRDQLRNGVKAIHLVGGLDEPKLRSSVRLFERVTRDSDAESIGGKLHVVLLDVLRCLREEPDP